MHEFDIVDPTSEDINPNGPAVGQEHIKDFGDPFIPERVYNGWKGNKDFEMMKVVLLEGCAYGRGDIRKMPRSFWGCF